MTPLKNTFSRFIAAVIVTALSLFLPAWDIFWRQAWVYIVIFFVPMALIARYLVKYDPELLKRRLQTKEIKPKQGVLSHLFYTSIGIAFVVSGLDHRYGWSNVPEVISFISAVIFLAGYYFLFLVFKINKYLAHTVRVEENQEVVSTGPYAFVRHPMYLAELIMLVSTPLVLGSYWALVSIILLVTALVIRIKTEEKVLLLELRGYGDYTQRTRYRFIPGIW